MKQTSARRDAAIVVFVSALAAIACVKFDVSEFLAGWTRPLERLQLDELPVVLLVVALCLVWFSSRRYFEAKRQLLLREAVESRLAAALAENRRLARNYVDMQESERRALARDLHDELGQYVNAIKLDAVSLCDAAAGQPAQLTVARGMIANIDRVYAVVGGLIRQLRPVGFDDLGIAAAIEHCVNEWRSRLPGTTIEISATGQLESLNEMRGMVIFRLVQEALTNIARHSAATQVRILIERKASADSIDILIADNGRGADLQQPRDGLGLIGMRERVAALGGSISLASGRGEGFRVMASIPVSDSF